MIPARRTSLVSSEGGRDVRSRRVDRRGVGRGSIAIVLPVAILLGLRHATDPDHLAAVTTLVVSGRERATRAAARSAPPGASGTPHARCVRRPDPPRGALPPRPRAAWGGDDRCGAHRFPRGPAPCPLAARGVRLDAGPDGAHTARGAHAGGAFGIGLVHGMGGSAGVGVLLLAAIPSRTSRSSRSSCSRCSPPSR